MKILQLTRQFLPSEGGIEAVVEGLSSALLKRGHTVDVATLRSIFETGSEAPQTSMESGIPVRRMRHWGPRRYPIAPAAVTGLRGYDVVHIHAIDFFVDYLSLLRFFHNVPIVVSTHGGIFHTPWAKSFKEFYFRTITRMSLKGVGGIVCVSHHDRDKFQQIVPSNRIRVIENGVSIDRFSGLKKQIVPGLILGVSRLAENKQIHRVIEAMAPLGDQFPEMRLEWVGADFDGLRTSLERRALDLGLEGRVQFHGAIDREQLCGLLSKAHMFVSASDYEGFGIATLEAMSAATVVVVTPVGVHPDVVHDNVSGFLIDRQANTLTQNIKLVLEMPREELLAIGDAARAATQRFSWTHVAPHYEQLYREVIETRGRRAARHKLWFQEERIG
jgi:alpha-1,3-mannosyltransferase